MVISHRLQAFVTTSVTAKKLRPHNGFLSPVRDSAGNFLGGSKVTFFLARNHTRCRFTTKMLTQTIGPRILPLIFVG